MVEIFSTSPGPGDLWDFAFFPERDRALRELAELAEPEDWTYKYTDMEHRYSVLFNYVRYTYEDVNRYLGIKTYGFVPMRLPLPPS